MYALLKKILFLLEPELAHALVKHSGSLFPKGLLKRLTDVSKPELFSQIGDTPLKNPIGLAAGFDKNAEMIEWLSALGFGFLEIGSVTSHACRGNEKPRIFRLPKDQSLINRMGLPNLGVDAVSKKLKANRSISPLGINIAKTPYAALSKAPKKGEEGRHGIEDMLASLHKLHSFGAYLVFNLSCPNTADGKTFEDPKVFEEFAKALLPARRKLQVTKPVLVKLSPTLEKGALKRLVEKACEYDFDGFVLSNTTPERANLKTERKKLEEYGAGGVSGKALLAGANRQLENVYEMVEGKKILIGVGGILSFDDLLAKLSRGASLFQIYTGLIYQGPLFVHKLNKKLASFCRKRGVKNYRELVGKKEIIHAA